MGNVPGCSNCDSCVPESSYEPKPISLLPALSSNKSEGSGSGSRLGLTESAEGAEAAGRHPIVTAGPDFESSISLINAGALRQLKTPWPRLQELPKENFLEPKSEALVVAVSHGWMYQAHPDPTGAKEPVVKAMLDQAVQARKHSGQTVCFFDFCSVPQRAFLDGQSDRTAEEQARFHNALCCMPSVYLLCDAVLHVDVALPEAQCIESTVLIDLVDLEGSSLLQNRSHVQIVKPANAKLRIFDVILSCDGQTGLTIAEVMRLLRSCKSTGRACTVELQRMPFGIRNDTPTGDRGWIYLERFVTMVKAAMVEESEFERVCFSNSPVVLQQIKRGSERLRKAALQGEEHIKRELEGFYQELDKMRFSGTSTDKILDTGERTKETDRDAVARIMHEMVLQLGELWGEEQRRQRQRQLSMAVNSGDAAVVAALLLADADVNYPGKDGETCLHKAALQDSLDVAKVLMKYKADVGIQDAHGNCPGHNLFLRMSDHIVEFFDLLVPDRQILMMENSRQVTPLRRFEVWASTADSGQPFAPAVEYLGALYQALPEVAAMATLGQNTSLNSSDSVILHHETRGVHVCGHAIYVDEWWAAQVDCKQHVFWVSFGGIAPPAIQRVTLGHLARRVCVQHELKLLALTRIGSLRGLSMDELQELLRKVVDALELPDKFIFVDDSRGATIGLLAELRPRLKGVLLINVHLVFSEEFLASPGFKKMQQILLSFGDIWRGGDFVKMAEHCAEGTHLIPDTAAMVVEKFRAALEAESQDYLDMNAWIWGLLGGEWANYMGTVVRFQMPFKNVPAVLACGAFAPEAPIVQSMNRVQSLFPQTEVTYIPNSKICYQLEGPEQFHCVFRLLEELLGKVDMTFSSV